MAQQTAATPSSTLFFISIPKKCDYDSLVSSYQSLCQLYSTPASQPGNQRKGVELSAHYKNNIQTSLSFPFSQVIFSKDHILAQKTEENFDF
jgi:hypothetical protein